jgi:hypothetical protein
MERLISLELNSFQTIPGILSKFQHLLQVSASYGAESCSEFPPRIFDFFFVSLALGDDQTSPVLGKGVTNAQ